MSKDPRYHPEWQTISRYIRELFNYHCARCEKNCRNTNKNEMVLQVHHIDENPKNNKIENLIPLCASCHLKIEAEARLHAPYHDKQMELFENQTYFTQMKKMRDDALFKYSLSSSSDKNKMNIEDYEISVLEWEKNESNNY